jgi:hypothetical protein
MRMRWAKNARAAANYVINNEREQQKENERVARERMRRLMVTHRIAVSRCHTHPGRG